MLQINYVLCIQRVKSNSRETVHFNFFDPNTKIHTFTNLYAYISKNDFKFIKKIF